MKKILLSSLILILTFTTLANEPKSGAGIKLHLNMVNQYGDDVNEDFSDPRNAFGATGFVSFQFGKYFSLQPELSYMSRGNQSEVSGETATTQLDYFQLAFFFRFTIPTNSPLTPSFFFGPSGALNIDAKSVYNDEETDLDNVRVYDAGPIFGAGIDYQIGPGAIVAEGRYYMGLLKLGEYDRLTYSNEPEIYNKALEFALGYKFNL